MAPSPAVPVKGKPLTVQDIIGFQADQAFRLGEVGFTTNFPKPEDISRPHTLNTAFEDVTNNDAAVVSAMQATHSKIHQLHQRQVAMEMNKPLLAETEAEVDRRLFAAGKSKRYVTAQSLRKKVVDLMELHEPKPESNFVTVWVKLDSMKQGKDMVQVNLPIKASIAEVYNLLDGIVESELASAGGKTVENAAPSEEPRHWRYQLLRRNLSVVVNDASIRLETTSDYRRMMAVITSGNQAPIAALARYAPKVEATESQDLCGKDEAPEDDGDFADEVFDENGQPFFEPLDWEMICGKFSKASEDDVEKQKIDGL